LVALASSGDPGKWTVAREELLVMELSIAGMNFNLRDKFPKKFLQKHRSAFEGFEATQVSDKLKNVFKALEKEDIKGEHNKKFLLLRSPVRIYPRPRTLIGSPQRHLWSTTTAVSSDLSTREGDVGRG
jgi:hypothetical protein